ncbi:MAG: membrane protein of unknown function [Candidatus Thorarchaeota archaeon]|nr:MAG: membrane protein of unknown function [Candidatus Thorarchaeota archaeon]
MSIQSEIDIERIQRILLIVILLLPIGIIWAWGQNLITVLGILWTIHLRPDLFGTEEIGVFPMFFDISTLFMAVVFSTVRFFVVIQVAKLYEMRTTKKRTYLVVLLAEMILPIFYALVSMPVLLVPGFPSILFVLGIPTPFLLLALWILISKYPPPEKSKTWFEEKG